MKPLCFLLPLTLAGLPLGAQDLSLLFPVRTIDAVVTWRDGEFAPAADAFTGDYPYRLRAGRDQLAVYTGIPLYFPVVLSLGSVNQVGYKDDYSEATPLATLTVGYQSRLGFLKGGEGGFALWGWRWDGLAGGLAYEFDHRAWNAGLGWFGPQGGLSTTARWTESGFPRKWGVTGRVALPGAWSVVGGVEHASGGTTWSLGLGTYLYEPAANALVDQPWDSVIAHRGSLLRAPENTEPAVELALREARVDGVELDVQRTNDGVYAFVHDDFLLRYNGTLERVTALSGRELRGRDFGRWFGRAFAGTPLMVLEDLAPIAHRSPHKLWVFDLKNVGQTAADAQAFLDATNRVVPQASVLVSTGDLRLLEALRPLSPRPLGLQIDVARSFFLWGDFFPPLLEFELGSLLEGRGVASFFLFSSKYANVEAVERVARKRGLSFYLWNFHDRIYGRDAQETDLRS